jgi:Fe-S cluster biogenesis protein NfuA
MRNPLDEVLENVLIPLIAADGGRLEVVERRPEKVVIRLSGACTGCPGVHYTRAHVIAPILRKALGSQVEVVVENSRPRPGDPLSD